MADADEAACCGSSSATNSVSCRNSMTCSMYDQVNFFVASQVGGKRRRVAIPNPSAKVVDVVAVLPACPQHNWSSACGHRQGAGGWGGAGEKRTPDSNAALHMSARVHAWVLRCMQLRVCTTDVAHSCVEISDQHRLEVFAVDFDRLLFGMVAPGAVGRKREALELVAVAHLQRVVELLKVVPILFASPVRDPPHRHVIFLWAPRPGVRSARSPKRGAPRAYAVLGKGHTVAL